MAPSGLRTVSAPSSANSPASDQLARLIPALADLLVDLVMDRLATQAPPTERLLRVGEAAELLGVSRTTVYQLIGRHELRSLKVRGRRLVPTSSVAELIAAMDLAHEGEAP